ncbi:MAG TPA: choice-of-anchor tandem repeat GloVer-containing protein [Phycisphaerae bacterium]|nr:choice-of-anchor tandem repeat GloVer-containing protein [Phycisphaerae bacterium]
MHASNAKPAVRSRRRSLAAAVLQSLEPRTLFSGYTFSTLAAFTGANGSSPFDCNLLADSHGNLFGMTSAGGTNSDGVVFEIHAGTSTITPLAFFNGNNGGAPTGTLVIDSAGNLFGVTSGGTNNAGSVFVIPNGSSTIATIATFPQGGSLGSSPLGLAVDSAGNLFGVTQNGGAYSNGTVFEIPKGSNAITTLIDFDGTNGGIPEGNLLVDSNGNLFGATERGGTSGNGALFEITAGSHTFSTLASFNSNGTNGISPMGDIVMDAQGNLFGTAQFGGITDGGQGSDGLVYELANGSSSITPFANFSAATGTSPFAGLIIDSHGNLFGTTTNAGANDAGTIFEILHGSSNITVLASLPGPYGDVAAGNLAIDASGNLFGTTDGGGNPSDNGIVFKLAPTQATKLAFTQQPANTIAGNTLSAITVQVEDAQGNIVNSDNSTITLAISSGPGTLSGTLTGSVINGIATFNNLSITTTGSYTLQATDPSLTSALSQSFSIIPSPLRALASFDATSGNTSLGGVVLDSHGNLFGTTSQGGANNSGTLFELPKGANSLTILASFNSATPSGPLLLDSAGNLFGLTSTGGTNNLGTLFELPAGAHAITTLASFSNTTGANPFGRLVRDSAGNLYGMTTTGGDNNDGTIFELPAGTNTPTALASFSNITWSATPDGLLLDSAGNLFGSTPTGGTNNDGTLFELPANSNTITTLASFSNATGITPRSLLIDPSGNLYGITSRGGDTDKGTLFVLPAGTASLGVIASFTSPTAFPNSLALDTHGNFFGTNTVGSLFEIPSGTGAVSTLATFTSTTGTSPLNLIVDSAGNLFGTTTANGANSSGTLFQFALAPATHLAFTTQPTSTTAGQNLNTLTVAIQDADGYTLASDDSTITLSVVNTNGVITSLTAQSHNGIATFSNLSLQAAGAYTLAANNGLLPAATSNPFSITPAAASQLILTSTPTSTTAGPLHTLTVTLEDPYGNIVTTDQSNITLSLNGNGTLLGTVTVPAINGVATFNTLAIHTPGSFSITASDGALPTATTTSFTITPAAASELVFLSQPTGGPVGPIGTLQIAVEDPFGNIVTSDASTITLSGAPLTGTLTVPTVNGIATFNNLSTYTPGTYTLTATDGSLAPATSAPFTINPIAPAPSAAKLIFSRTPANTIAGNTLSTLNVRVLDAAGHIVTADNSLITLSIATGPSGAALHGTLTVQAHNGIATFNDLSLQIAGQYTLFAADSSLASGTTANFTITPAAPAQISFQQNLANATAGAIFAPTLGLSITDAFGNSINTGTARLTIQAGPAGAQLRGTTTAPIISGAATLKNLSLLKAGTYTLRAAAGSATAASTTFTITPAAATRLVFSQQPTSTHANATLAPAISVSLFDAFGNLATNNHSLITLSIASGPKGPALHGPISSPLQNGIATFAGLSLTPAGNYKLKATSGLLSTISTAFTITPAVGSRLPSTRRAKNPLQLLAGR